MTSGGNYHESRIRAVTGCSAKDVVDVAMLMREYAGTLDRLTARQYSELAIRCCAEWMAFRYPTIERAFGRTVR